MAGTYKTPGSPIFVQQWPDTADLNARLREVVLKKRETTPGLKKSNCGGWHSQTDFQLWDDPAVRELLTMLHGMVHDVVRATTGANPVDDPELFTDWDVESWANVNQLTDSAAQHTHVGGLNLWSAIYYVDTGEANDEVVGGVTRFIDLSGIPRPITGADGAARVRAPIASLQDRCGLSPVGEQYDLEIQPVPGKMVFFPSTLPHYVTPYLGTGRRITLAFNLRHKDFVVPDAANPHAGRRTMWRDYRGLMMALYRGKQVAREGLAKVVPVERWPTGVRRRLLGGS
jgi:hypothetical protein